MNVPRWAAALAVAAALGPSPAMAREGKGAEGSLSGVWAGALKVAPQLELRIVLKVEKGPDGKPKATMTSPDQSPEAIPVDAIELKGDTLTFSVKKIGGAYTGKRSKDGKQFVGEWSQGGGKLPLTLAAADEKAVAGPVAPKELAGLWEGKLDINGAALRLVLRVEKPKGRDDLVPVLDSPDQGIMGIPVTAIALEGGNVTFENKSIGGRFAGKLDAEKGQIEGTWTQGGRDFPLTLKKTGKVSQLNRPQHPKAPLPYRAEDVRYRNEAAGIELAGTLTLPTGEGPFPAALLITGSGAQDRDETLLGHKPFLVLADALTRRGIAVLRVDDRGVGGSGGDPAEATTEDFAGDALAGVAHLNSRPEIDPKAVGLVGHSEGGVVGPMAAARSEDVAFIVLLAGTGLPGDEILLRQNELILRAAKLPDRAVARQVEALRRLIEIVKSEPDNEKAAGKMKGLVAEIAGNLEGDDKEALGLSGDTVGALSRQLASPWFRYFLGYDPRPALEQVRCPVLAVIGENDLQVPADANLAEIERALKAGGNTRYAVEKLPGLNHLFQHSETGSPSEYGAIEETFAPEALERVGNWILEQTRPAAPAA